MADTYPQAIERAADYANGLGSDISGKIITDRNGVRIEVDHRPSGKHAEDGRSWEEMDAGAHNELISIIDELVRTVRD